ncbi:glutamate-cysteine ligase-domain-containing protein [Pisolithus tinctorius]|nr:glutamate-cysteine ligase-domain-containing protein [Pisolithus tinctorius]
MGVLCLGTPLTWEETKNHADHVRNHGIIQFIHTWHRVKDRTGDELLWGDEVECMVVVVDDEKKEAKVSLRQAETLEELGKIVGTLSNDTSPSTPVAEFHPEYGRFMLESTPGSPYTGSIAGLLSMETNMHYRRTLARNHLRKNEILLTLTSFPRLGTVDVFTEPHYDPKDAKSSRSLFLPEEITHPHTRFSTLTANIRNRRGSKVVANLPIFRDERTPQPFVDPTIPWQRDIYPEDSEAKNGAALIDHIYMDAMGFGGGCCCLQLTFQCCSVNGARRMYDALIPVGPLMLALTAASPIWRGYLADVDCRWNVIMGVVDDRTREERGLEPLKNSRYIIPKSRYDNVSLYISSEWANKPAYNDTVVPYDEAIKDRLLSHGIDEMLSKHIAHLFIRDPLIIFSETIHQDDSSSVDHFESIHSTNWQSLRLKPPPPGSSMGWRVEFRTMEVQMTDFENAAFAVFIVLLSRAILAFKLNFYVPISKVDENMQRAQKRDATRTQNFFFRKNVVPQGYATPAAGLAPSGSSTPSECGDCGMATQMKERKLRNCFPTLARPPTTDDGSVEDEYEEMSIKEIFCGKGPTFPGLLGLVDAYLGTLELTPVERKKIDKYLDLVRGRADGTLQTPATWIRSFVRSHPAYKFDSVVSQEINYDLLIAIDRIERGTLCAPELLPEGYSQPYLNGFH